MMDETVFTIVVSGILLACLCILFRLIMVLPCTKPGKHTATRKHAKYEFTRVSSSCPRSKMMVLLGSGGHTGEMIRILEQWHEGVGELEREYILSSGDSTSVIKLQRFEEDVIRSQSTDYKITTIYRARNIGEGKLKALGNTLISFLSTFKHLILNRTALPDIFLTNGPGTAIPIAYILFILKFFGICNTKIIYIESLARVNELSLTGLLILPIADRIIVQWETLSRKYRRCEYYGILV